MGRALSCVQTFRGLGLLWCVEVGGDSACLFGRQGCRTTLYCRASFISIYNQGFLVFCRWLCDLAWASPSPHRGRIHVHVGCARTCQTYTCVS